MLGRRAHMSSKLGARIAPSVASLIIIKRDMPGMYRNNYNCNKIMHKRSYLEMMIIQT
jgi:hypothetical protein